ncbi:MAG: hypothetical protein ACJAXV_000331 [Bacteroidia bacterium]|jgi:hypothetical protein|tara:strand:+ start:2437 stop:3174 length:738 start_codon:yes stop_codon:yes gene_type:complete
MSKQYLFTIFSVIISLTVFSQYTPYIPSTDLDFQEKVLREKQNRYDINVNSYNKEKSKFLKADVIIQDGIEEYDLTHLQEQKNAIVRRFKALNTKLKNGNYDFSNNGVANYFINGIKRINEDFYAFSKLLIKPETNTTADNLPNCKGFNNSQILKVYQLHITLLKSGLKRNDNNQDAMVAVIYELELVSITQMCIDVWYDMDKNGAIYTYNRFKDRYGYISKESYWQNKYELEILSLIHQAIKKG